MKNSNQDAPSNANAIRMGEKEPKPSVLGLSGSQDSGITRIRSSITSGIKEDVKIALVGDDTQGRFLYEVSQRSLPTNTVGKIMAFLSNASLAELNDKAKHIEFSSLYSHLERIMNNWKHTYAGNILGARGGNRDTNGDLTPIKAPIVGLNLSYLNGVYGNYSGLSPSDVRVLEEAVDRAVLEILTTIESEYVKKEIDPKIITLFRIAFSSDAFGRDTADYNQDIIDMVFDLATTLLRGSDFKSAVQSQLSEDSYFSPNLVKEDGDAFWGTCTNMVASYIHSVLDIFRMHPLQAYRFENSSLVQDELSMIHQNVLITFKLYMYLNVTEETEHTVYSKEITSLLGLDAVKVAQFISGDQKSHFENYCRIKPGSKMLSQLGGIIYDKVIAVDTAKSYMDVMKSLMQLDQIQNEIIDFTLRAEEYADSGFDDVEDLFREWRHMMTTLTTFNNEVGANEMIDAFVQSPLFANSLAGQLFRLTRSELNVDIFTMAKHLAKMSDASVLTTWDRTGAADIAELSVESGASDPYGLPHLNSAKTFSIHTKQFPAIENGRGSKSFRFRQLTRSDLFEGGKLTNGPLAKSFYTMMFFQALADVKTKESVRRKEFRALQDQFFYETKMKDAFLTKLGKICSAMSIQLAIYRRSIEDVLLVQSLAFVDVLDGLTKFYSLEGLRERLPIDSSLVEKFAKYRDSFVSEFASALGRDISIFDRPERLNRIPFLEEDSGNISFIKDVPDFTDAYLNLSKSATLSSVGANLINLVHTIKPTEANSLSPNDAESVLKIGLKYYKDALPKYDLHETLEAMERPEQVPTVSLTDKQINFLAANMSVTEDSLSIVTYHPVDTLLHTVTGEPVRAPFANVIFTGSRSQQHKLGFSNRMTKSDILDPYQILSLGGDVNGYVNPGAVSVDVESGAIRHRRLIEEGFSTLGSLLLFAVSRAEVEIFPSLYSENEIMSGSRGYNLDDVLSLVGRNSSSIIESGELMAIVDYFTAVPERNIMPLVLKRGLTRDQLVNSSRDVYTLGDVFSLAPWLRGSGDTRSLRANTIYLRMENSFVNMMGDRIYQDNLKGAILLFSDSMRILTENDSFNYVLRAKASIPRVNILSDPTPSEIETVYNNWRATFSHAVRDLMKTLREDSDSSKAVEEEDSDTEAESSSDTKDE